MTDKTEMRPASGKDAGGTSGDEKDDIAHSEEKRDESLEASMDASDPPTTSKPGDHGDPVPSSGFRKEDD